MMSKKLHICLLAIVWLACCVRVSGQQVRPVKVNALNAAAYRDSLIDRIFGSPVFPYNILPDTLISNVNSIDHYTGFPYTSILFPDGNLDSIDKIEVSLSPNLQHFPEKVKIYLFHPHTPNGKLFIYHSGHCAGVALAEDVFANNGGTAPGKVIPAMIAAGYTVLAVPMLHYQSPTPDGYNCGYNGHNELFTDGNYPFPLGMFFTPLIASLNLLGRDNYTDIYMCGLSGGGWASSIYPAIDSSIRVSVAVAGSWPMEVRRAFYPAIGDYEQFYPPIFNSLLDYHDLYTLSCLAPARKMLQINNRYDPCCFSGAYAHIYYADSVVNALQGSGGDFRFYLDETGTEHAISNKALQVMLAYINGQTGELIREPVDTVENGDAYFYDIKEQFIANPPSSNISRYYSLLKAPDWLTLDAVDGTLSGTAPPGNIVAGTDSISFKVEDIDGRFVVYNYNLARKRPACVFFTINNDRQTVYLLPQFAHSMVSADLQSTGLFFFNNPALSVTDIKVMKNSYVMLTLNQPLTATDSIGYTGNGNAYSLLYSNGNRLNDIPLSQILTDIVADTHARPGMMRFNTDSMTFEYFNGSQWVNMND